MRTLTAGFLIAASALLFTSCQKEIGFDSITTADSTISKIVVLDTTFSSGIDTVEKIEFFYDGSGRLLKAVDSQFIAGVASPARNVEEDIISYEYTGSADLPSRILTKYNDILGPAVDFDTSYLSYADGFVSRDSFTNGGGVYIVAQFVKQSANRFFAYHKTYINQSLQVTDTSHVFLNSQNGNLLKEIDSLWVNPGGPWVPAAMDIMYDNKPNPFKSFSVPYPAPFFQHYPGTVGIPVFSLRTNNNPLKATNDMGATYIISNYEYGPSGLPKIMRDGSERKYFYFYK